MPQSQPSQKDKVTDLSLAKREPSIDVDIFKADENSMLTFSEYVSQRDSGITYEEIKATKRIPNESNRYERFYVIMQMVRIICGTGGPLHLKQFSSTELTENIIYYVAKNNNGKRPDESLIRSTVKMALSEFAKEGLIVRQPIKAGYALLYMFKTS